MTKNDEKLIIDEFDLDLKKKKKKKKKIVLDKPKKENLYTYKELLDRIFNKINSKNPNLNKIKRVNIKPPYLVRNGRKTTWVNFKDTCEALNRSTDHVISYFTAELGVEGSYSNNKLLMNGKFIPKYIESILQKYILEYVKCKMCNSVNTNFCKDNINRLYFIECSNCSSTRYTSAIRKGFHAETKEDRRKKKN